MKNTKNKGDSKDGFWRRLTKLVGYSLLLALTVFFRPPLYGQETQRAPINVNLIIDGSESFTGVRAQVTSWVNNRLDQILADGDRVTVWSAGVQASVIYSDTITSSAEREAVKRSIGELTVSGTNADFTGALREAAARQSTGFSYTLLISASPQALSSVISGPNANLLRYSRIEDFTNWRALVVGLNIDTRVRRAAGAFFGS